MIPTPSSVFDLFGPNDDVRLISQHGDIRAGSVGRIIGRFSRDDCTYLVHFASWVGCVELLAHEIKLA